MSQHHGNPDYNVVELDPETMEVVAEWSSISRAAEEHGCSRQAIHQAVHDGSIRMDRRWMFKHVYESWKRSFDNNSSRR